MNDNSFERNLHGSLGFHDKEISEIRKMHLHFPIMGMTYPFKQLDFSPLGCVVLNLIKIGPVVLKKASKKSLLHISFEIYHCFLRRLFKVFNIFPLLTKFKSLYPKLSGLAEIGY